MTDIRPVQKNIGHPVAALHRFVVRVPKIPLFIWFAIVVLVGALLVALVAPLIAPYDYTAINLRARLSPPLYFGGSADHVLGTDALGRDVLSRLIFSIRTSMFVAFGATAVGAFFGTSLGFIAAHFRGWVEQGVLALVDFQAALPFLLLALAVLAFVGNSMTILVFLLGLHGWERYARLARALAISANSQGYASAVRQLGAHPLSVYVGHILPNIASTLIVSMTIAFPEIILVESGLSFLGLGVQPPGTSLGSMVGFGRDYMTSAPWILFLPAAVICVTALSVSLLGDWLRDQLDGTMK